MHAGKEKRVGLQWLQVKHVPDPSLLMANIGQNNSLDSALIHLVIMQGCKWAAITIVVVAAPMLGKVTQVQEAQSQSRAPF